MSHHTTVIRVSLILACLGLTASARQDIIPSPASNTWDLHGEAGLTIISGFDNVLNQLKTNFGIEHDSSWPIGIRLSGYVENSDGLAFGGSIGPCEIFLVKDHTHRRHQEDDNKWSYIIPVSADIRYFFPKYGTIIPYVRAGIAYPISGGEYIGSATPGPVVAIGAHVWEHRIVAVGVEAGYDGSQVKVKDGPLHGAENVRPVEFTFSVFAAF
jgi:hypothetical protein